MAFKFSVRVRNARADATESTIGPSPILRLYTGAEPADCASAPTGTLLASLTLPADWQANASGGSKVLSGTWSGTASVAGTAGYFRVWDSGLTNCDMQGSVTMSPTPGDLVLINTNIAAGQPITIDGFTTTEGNA